jgi:NAD(P)-dependent dehydrogenase (short-subunit alcohol dehydrogenase family)
MRRMLDVNLLGVVPGITHAFLAMHLGRPAGLGGSVINLASVAATPTPRDAGSSTRQNDRICASPLPGHLASAVAQIGGYARARRGQGCNGACRMPRNVSNLIEYAPAV